MTMTKAKDDEAIDKNASAMSFAEYQDRVLSTCIYPNVGSNFTYPALGLCGEAGEVAEKVKKVIRDKGGVLDDASRLALKKELGDVAFYLTAMCSELGFTLEEVLQANVDKLQGRKERGTLQGSGDDR